MSADRPEPKCADQPDLFTSTNKDHHALAKAVCLGRDGKPPCPMLAGCRDIVRDFQASVWQGGLHGTWAGRLYGKKLGNEDPKFKPKPREHGTDRGYHQHRHLKETVCAECKAAHYVELGERFGVEAR